MGRFVYSMMVSLDGFIDTPQHGLDWVIVDEELHRFVNAQATEKAGLVCGRRLYEVLRVWDTMAQDQPDLADYMVEFAEVWNTKPKVVISSSLETVGANARLLRPDDVGDELQRLHDQTDGDLDIGGPTLAAAAISRGLVDEYRLFVQPVTLGAGTPFFHGTGGSACITWTPIRSRPGSHTLPIGPRRRLDRAETPRGCRFWAKSLTAESAPSRLPDTR